MKYLKKNKWVLVPITVFVVVMIFAIFGIVNLVIPNDSKNLYGNRLDGIENYVIKEETISIIKEELMKTEKVKSIDYDLKGKLINFIIMVKNETDKVSAQGLTDKILSGFDEEIKKFYDFQVFIKTEEESEIFPIIGYKHVTSVNFVWTNN